MRRRIARRNDFVRNFSAPICFAKLLERILASLRPTDHVLEYQTNFGRGSPSLHSNLFRYAMLHQLGGWWIDVDVILLQQATPRAELFFAQMGRVESGLNPAVLKFPAGHPLLAEARDQCIRLGESVSRWGETGPTLFTKLVELNGGHELAAGDSYAALLKRNKVASLDAQADSKPDPEESKYAAQFFDVSVISWRKVMPSPMMSLSGSAAMKGSASPSPVKANALSVQSGLS